LSQLYRVPNVGQYKYGTLTYRNMKTVACGVAPQRHTSIFIYVSYHIFPPMSFVTILTFDTHTQATPVKSLLDSYDIYCHLKNEHAGNNPHIVFHNLLTRIELQVKTEDFDTAKNILIEYGYYKEPEEATDTLWQKIDKATANWPLVNDRPVFFRLLFVIIPLLFIIISTLIYYNQPTDFEQLTTRQWCIEGVEYKGNTIPIRTTGVFNDYAKKCMDELIMWPNNSLMLPGSYSGYINGTWAYNKDNQHMMITSTDTLEDIYKGEYIVELDGYELTLRSDNTVIHARDARGIYRR